MGKNILLQSAWMSLCFDSFHFIFRPYFLWGRYLDNQGFISTTKSRLNIIYYNREGVSGTAMKTIIYWLSACAVETLGGQCVRQPEGRHRPLQASSIRRRYQLFRLGAGHRLLPSVFGGWHLWIVVFFFMTRWQARPGTQTPATRHWRIASRFLEILSPVWQFLVG